VALSPYRRFLRRGLAGPVILTKSGAFLCVLRLHPSDLESQSSERRARVCEALAQIFSTLGDGWGTWINVISRARRQYLERGALWHSTMVTVDEAQRRRLRTRARTTSASASSHWSISRRHRTSSGCSISR
jgi:type IV secretory pathway VirB4 component